eukprot:3583657-Amphidinium_carterae.2
MKVIQEDELRENGDSTAASSRCPIPATPVGQAREDIGYPGSVQGHAASTGLITPHGMHGSLTPRSRHRSDTHLGGWASGQVHGNKPATETADSVHPLPMYCYLQESDLETGSTMQARTLASR